ncbi:MAG: N-acetyltransferase family protein [Leeuwenhoekiella sp.]
MKIKIRPFKAQDYPQVARIYEEGMATGIATFETKVPDYPEWNNRFVKECRFIVEENESIIGWCALSKKSSREVYKGVAEVTLYIGSKNRGKGIGKRLLSHLIEQSEEQGYWTLTAHIFPENTASINLHEQLGFRKVGYYENVAKRGEKWYNNLIFERRSLKIGLN